MTDLSFGDLFNTCSLSSSYECDCIGSWLLIDYCIFISTQETTSSVWICHLLYYLYGYETYCIQIELNIYFVITSVCYEILIIDTMDHQLIEEYFNMNMDNMRISNRTAINGCDYGICYFVTSGECSSIKDNFLNRLGKTMTDQFVDNSTSDEWKRIEL